MKLELDQEDIQSIAKEVAESLRPLLASNGKVEGGDALFDVKGLAKYLKLDASWIYKHVSLRTIPFFKVGKYTRFKKSAIDRWIDNKTIKPISSLKLINNSK